MKKTFFLFFVLFAAAVAFWQAGLAESFLATTHDVPAVEAPKAEAVYVYVSGAVKKPGLYSFPQPVRSGDVVTAAGGVVAYADTDAINLADEAVDGSHIHIPYRFDGVPADPERDGLVNINTADEKKLTEIPGVGPAMAQKIMAYRMEHGSFGSVEELCNVKGIGKAKFEKMKDKVTV